MRWAALFTFVGLFLFASCAKEGAPAATQASATPMVLVSSPPYAYLTQLVAGDTVQVECLIPPGTNPHLFELPPNQVQKVLQSSLLLRLGEPMEEKFLGIFRAHNPGLEIVDLSDGIAMIVLPHEHGDHSCCSHDGQDRHFWTSPTLAKQQLATIAGTLEKMYPEHSAQYRENLARGLDLLSQIDQDIRSILTEAPNVIAISHPALGYFCRDYGIEQLSIEIEGKEPLPGDLAALVEQIRQKSVNTILLLPQHNNQGALRLADLLSLRLQMIDPYDPDYPAAMRATALAIANSSSTKAAL